jgi:hypothetical protein
MILGEFKWRDVRVEVDEIITGLAGSVVWLNQVDNGTGLGMIRDGRLIMSANAPKDDLAQLELENAFKQFRASIAGAPA